MIVVACIYGYVAFEKFMNKDYGNALAWACYGIANVGFIWQGIIEIARRTTP
jgi:hypothetical protein